MNVAANSDEIIRRNQCQSINNTRVIGNRASERRIMRKLLGVSILTFNFCTHQQRSQWPNDRYLLYFHELKRCRRLFHFLFFAIYACVSCQIIVYLRHIFATCVAKCLNFQAAHFFPRGKRMIFRMASTVCRWMEWILQYFRINWIYTRWVHVTNSKSIKLNCYIPFVRQRTVFRFVELRSCSPSSLVSCIYSSQRRPLDDLSIWN